MNFKKLLFASVIVLSANATIAQKTAGHKVNFNIPEMAILDLEGPAVLTPMTFTAEVSNPGLPIAFIATNSDIWMNYSTILGTASSRTVTIGLDNAIPKGLKLTVTNAGDAGKGEGTTGNASVITFINSEGTVAKDIITGIGSAYTGDGVNNGHKLTYQIGLEDNVGTNYGSLIEGNTLLTITYTLIDVL